MEENGPFFDELKASLHHALERAIDTQNPTERAEAIAAAIAGIEELCLVRSGELVRRILRLHGLV